MATVFRKDTPFPNDEMFWVSKFCWDCLPRRGKLTGERGRTSNQLLGDSRPPEGKASHGERGTAGGEGRAQDENVKRVLRSVIETVCAVVVLFKHQQMPTVLLKPRVVIITHCLPTKPQAESSQKGECPFTVQ